MIDAQGSTADVPIVSASTARWSRIAYATLLVLTILFLEYAAISCFQKATTIIDPYDGSYNAMVARTLAFQGRYGVWDNGRLVLCPVEVTTGPAMLLPIAVAYPWMGDSPFLPNVVSTVLCFSVLLLAWAIALRCAGGQSAWCAFSLLIAVFTLLILTTKTGNFDLWWTDLGDVLAGLFLVAATASLGYVFQRRQAVFWGSLSGVLSAAAFNTKFLVVLPLAALGAFLVVSAFCRWIPRAALASWLIALGATELCFELFTLVQMGSVQAYLDHWKEFWKFFGQGGSGLKAPKPSLAQLVADHAATYRNELHWGGWVLLLLMLLAIFSAYCLAQRKGSCNGWLGAACTVQIAPVLLWWFGYSNLSWFRHVVPVLVLLPFCCHFLISDVAMRAKSARGWATVFALWPGALILSFAISPWGTWVLPHTIKIPVERTKALLAFGSQIELLRKEHPDARFWGAGWLRHWDVQVVTHLSCLNLLDPPPDDRPGMGAHDYVIDSDFFNWDHHPITTAYLAQNKQNLILSNNVFHLYQLKAAGGGEAAPSASHKNHGVFGDSLAALHDGVAPTRSSDGTVPRFTWWDHCGTKEWVQYDYKEPILVSGVEVYWYDDTGTGACRTPQSWRLLAREGEVWKPVEGAGRFGCQTDAFNRVVFQAVKTTGLRLEVQLKPGFSGGILEWKVE